MCIRYQWSKSFRAYLDTLYAYRDACDDILDKVQSTGDLLKVLQTNYDSVEDKTKTLQMACEKLLADQTQLAEMAENLAIRLSYFNELEPIAKLFASPGDQVCLDEKFVPMLLHLDECLAFVQSHVSSIMQHDIWARHTGGPLLISSLLDAISRCRTLPNEVSAMHD